MSTFRARFWFICLAALAAWFCTSTTLAQFSLPGSSLGNSTPENVVKASGVFTAPKDGKPAMLFVTAEVAPGWHIFSLTQAPGGPIKSKITLDASAEYKLAGDFKPLQPAKVHSDAVYPGLPIEEHEGQVTWGAPVEMAAGVDPAKLEFKGALNAQACSNVCIAPADYKFVAKLGAAPKDADRALLAEVPSPSPNGADPKPTGIVRYKANHSHVTLSGVLQPAVATPGSVAQLIITAEPATGWHIYALEEKDPQDVAKPTLIALTETSSFRYRGPQPSAPPVEKPSTVNQSGKDRYYDKPVSWTIDLEVPRDAKAGKYLVAGMIGYQTCSDASCDPPLGAKFEGTLTVGDAKSKSTAPVLFREGKYSEAAALAEKKPPEASAQGNTSNGAKSQQTSTSPIVATTVGSNADTGGFDEELTAKNIQSDDSAIVIVLSAFFGGLILNLMPCVFPVIGLKILSFVEQSHHDRRKLLVLNLWYSAGVVAVFLALAATAVVLRQFVGVDFKYGNQNGIQGYAIGMAAVMFVMGLSLLGIWEIPIPGFLGSGKAGEMMTHEGAAGAMAKGAITTLLGASCSAPVVAVAFAFALDRQTAVWATFGTFAIIGLGMSCPYLIIGANPRLVKFLPKPGAWMETFKHICGFVLLGAMVWVLTWLKMPYVAPTVAFLVGLWAACWWIGHVPLTAPPAKRLRAWGWGIALSIAVGLFAFNWLAPDLVERYNDEIDRNLMELTQANSSLPGGLSTRPAANSSDDSRLPWQPFSKQLLKQLTRERKTVLVDFTANWCPNCKTLEHWVLNTAPVKSAVSRNGVVPLVADYTDIPPELTEMLTILKAGAVPVLAIFPAGDPNHPIVFRNGYTSRTLIDALDKAGPSQAVASVKETAMK